MKACNKPWRAGLVDPRSNADSLTFSGTLNATTNSTPANMPRDGSSTQRRDDISSSIFQENEGELGEAGVDMQDLVEQSRALMRARDPYLNINLHKYDAANSTCLESKERCCICLDEYFDGENLAKIDCGHLYHVGCIKEWNKLENTFPVCKRRISAMLP
ncbi:uncharacterized protein LOC132057993 [Lycium ferocissimum]|uniref:uncharacterized protein LOC132057993 n=1 Tax=Lycium ferocissimum TaxID=112874 RepID=UPI002815F353|nr:uncharacterized protein LOC132057993 [Lycium ferocissimum]